MKELEQDVLRSGIGNMKYAMEQQAGDDPEMIYLCGAEMDFPTAPVIRRRLVKIAENGLYGFTEPDDTYRNAIISWQRKVRGVEITGEDIVPTYGTIMALNTAIRAFTKEGDSVLLQAPSYFRFDHAITNNHRKILYNQLCYDPLEKSYHLDLEDLEQCMRQEKVRLMVLCNPHNPTGAVFPLEDLLEVHRMSVQYHVVVFADEIFGEMQFRDPPVSYGMAGWENTILSTSLGKAFNFTGVSHANLLIRDQTLREKYLQQLREEHFGSIDPFFYNALIAGYSREGYEWLLSVKDKVQENDRILREGLFPFRNLVFPTKHEGTFIEWLDMRGLHLTDEDLASFMRHRVHVLGDPGTEYGTCGSGFFRINLATPTAHIRTLTERFVKLLSKGGRYADHSI